MEVKEGDGSVGVGARGGSVTRTILEVGGNGAGRGEGESHHGDAVGRGTVLNDGAPGGPWQVISLEWGPEGGPYCIVNASNRGGKRP